MSAVASFYILDASKLDDLKLNAEIIIKKGLFSRKVIDNYWNYLSSNSIKLKSLEDSGYIFANLLVYLQEEKDIDLLTNEYDKIAKELVDKRGNSHFLFSHKQKDNFLTKLEPNLYPLAEIQKFNQEFSGEGNKKTAELTLHGIELLRDNLSKIQNENQVLLLIVG